MLAMAILAVIQLLFRSIRTEKALMRNLSIFYHGCGMLLSHLSIEHSARRDRLSKRCYESHVFQISLRLMEMEGRLDYKLYPENTPQMIHNLLNGVQGITFRLEDLYKTYDQFGALPQTLSTSVMTALKRVQEHMQGLVEGLASLDEHLISQESSMLHGGMLTLKQEIKSSDTNKAEHMMDENTLQEAYIFLGSIRGLIEMILKTQHFMREICWSDWEKGRFSAKIWR